MEDIILELGKKYADQPGRYMEPQDVQATAAVLTSISEEESQLSANFKNLKWFRSECLYHQRRFPYRLKELVWDARRDGPVDPLPEIGADLEDYIRRRIPELPVDRLSDIKRDDGTPHTPNVRYDAVITEVQQVFRQKRLEFLQAAQEQAARLASYLADPPEDQSERDGIISSFEEPLNALSALAEEFYEILKEPERVLQSQSTALQEKFQELARSVPGRIHGVAGGLPRFTFQLYTNREEWKLAKEAKRSERVARAEDRKKRREGDSQDDPNPSDEPPQDGSGPSRMPQGPPAWERQYGEPGSAASFGGSRQGEQEDRLFRGMPPPPQKDDSSSSEDESVKEGSPTCKRCQLLRRVRKAYLVETLEPLLQELCRGPNTLHSSTCAMKLSVALGCRKCEQEESKAELRLASFITDNAEWRRLARSTGLPIDAGDYSSSHSPGCLNEFYATFSPRRWVS
jgi:hypothetical protein